ncbi:His-Xaa-Ser system protein HxsD [Pseudomonas protegens]|uniref:His-Xaa-Ser system protein HxsD n=1 Tax=Pseudomonas protegens TaxID=380021 RepID=UPI003826DE50
MMANRPGTRQNPHTLQGFQGLMLMTWPVTLHLSDTAYTLSAAKRTAYSLAAELAIQITPEPGFINLTIYPSSAQTALSIDHARALVLQHLNDFALRDHIHSETAGLREVLARAALTGCGLPQ